MKYTKEVLIKLATFSIEELAWIQSRRRKHNQLGFAYQLAYVKLHNRFPVKEPLKLSDQLLRFVSTQLEIKPGSIKAYKQREATVLEHQNQIRSFLGLFRFGEAFSEEIRSFIFEKACQLEQTHALLSLLRDYLRKQAILEPAESSLRRIIHHQRQKAREFIFDKIFQALSPENKDELDKLLQTESNSYSPLQHLKQSSSRASARAIISICKKLDQIEASGVLAIDLSWLNNNLQRWMNRYVRKATAFRLRELPEKKRYAMLLCFLKQHYRDLTDDLVRTYEKVISQMYSRTQSDLDTHQRRHRKTIRASLISFQTLVDCLLNESIKDRLLRTKIFQQIEKAKLSSQREQVDDWLNGKHKDTFTLLVNTRFSYLRQFSPTLIEHLSIEKEDSKDLKLIESVELIREMNALGKRKLPSELPIPMDFIPKSMQELVLNSQGEIDKPAWECALLTKLKDHIKSGNIAIKNSKRYGHLDDFFMPEHLWESRRDDFFQRAGLPKDSSEVKSFLSKKLDKAFDQFLEKLPHNSYAQLDQSGWKMSKDESVEMNAQDKDKLEKIEKYLARHMRIIKLPQLLIEVDNELHFSKYFMNPAKQQTPNTQDICAIMATVMAHGCNIGPYTMSHLIEGVSYHRIKRISDWLLTEEAQRGALSVLVNAISSLDITKYWGSGKTSASDGQRFSWRRKVLQQGYSPKFQDFALEFYTFIADNYAPYYSLPVECTDRDAPYVLDGLMYNESDLEIEEHYTDTHGYSEINFAAFAMLGKRFSPRIRGMHKQRIYRIDKTKDYGPLSVLLNKKNRTAHMDWITDQWDRMGHFYASLESGYVTASTALKRLNGYTGKNHFYRANRELGRIFKTEQILKFMSDRTTRSNTTRGLLKSEQLHQLARDLKYAKRGKITSRDWLEQKNSCSCLTLILACIIYWQAKEIHRVLLDCPPENELDMDMLKHISPITWDNVILYGEYIIDHNWIKL